LGPSSGLGLPGSSPALPPVEDGGDVLRHYAIKVHVKAIGKCMPAGGGLLGCPAVRV
jgi:hypothetical protein